MCAWAPTSSISRSYNEMQRAWFIAIVTSWQILISDCWKNFSAIYCLPSNFFCSGKNDRRDVIIKLFNCQNNNGQLIRKWVLKLVTRKRPNQKVSFIISATFYLNHPSGNLNPKIFSPFWTLKKVSIKEAVKEAG